MGKVWRRGVVAGVLSLMATAGGLLVAGTAEAQAVKSGTLSFSGDSGDYISQGDSWSYSTANGDGLSVSSSSGSTVAVSVNAYNGDWWTLTFDAPGTQVLSARTYSAAHRHPFNGTGPGLDLSGEGRGCNELTGSFTVTKAVFGPDGYVQAFDATFEQHCEGGDPAARGRVHIANPAPPRATTTERATTPERTTTSRPRTKATSPRTTKSPGAKATKPPAATTSPAPSTVEQGAAPPAGGGITDVQLAAAVLRDGTVVRRALTGAAIIALLGLAATGLLVAGLVRNSRDR